MQTRENILLRMKRMPRYLALYTGQMPEQKDMDRFFSRHGVDAQQVEDYHE
jgi:hypothetical protein